MNDYDSLYCKLYVDCDVNRNELVGLIAKSTSGKIERGSVSTPKGEIDVINNDDFDNNKRSKLPDGFLYYRFYLDIERTEGTERGLYIESISRLLEDFWLLSYKAVAACDFEEELPRKGGYNWQDKCSDLQSD
ncbi:hypothetical protein Cri9333_0687 [Crinalium epipsammum PCC 9333]|uniref:Uncharacterized protein n=1 Tax=Crinalium epipsammum PCC 9333 TaxID=1173022 RepID=K9VWU2_9CYAN|nr:hypothetical protein [Crinalium epipsammum]AFZ11620.1 hypothetical protein Cri9333_0687 [Crinalium epipsammum PCC 9333]